MSQRTIALHELGVAAINAGEISEEILEEGLAPGFHLENTSTAVTDKTYYGAAGLREWISDLFDAFAPDARYQSEEILADGEDFVVAMVRIVGRGARSGAPLSLRWVNVTWYKDDKATRAVGYLNRRHALKAVGIEA